MRAEGEEGLPFPRSGASLSPHSAIRRAGQGVRLHTGMPRLAGCNGMEFSELEGRGMQEEPKRLFIFIRKLAYWLRVLAARMDVLHLPRSECGVLLGKSRPKLGLVSRRARYCVRGPALMLHTD